MYRIIAVVLNPPRESQDTLGQLFGPVPRVNDSGQIEAVNVDSSWVSTLPLQSQSRLDNCAAKRATRDRITKDVRSDSLLLAP